MVNPMPKPMSTKLTMTVRMLGFGQATNVANSDPTTAAGAIAVPMERTSESVASAEFDSASSVFCSIM